MDLTLSCNCLKRFLELNLIKNIAQSQFQSGFPRQKQHDNTVIIYSFWGHCFWLFLKQRNSTQIHTFQFSIFFFNSRKAVHLVIKIVIKFIFNQMKKKYIIYTSKWTLNRVSLCMNMTIHKKHTKYIKNNETRLWIISKTMKDTRSKKIHTQNNRSGNRCIPSQFRYIRECNFESERRKKNIIKRMKEEIDKRVPKISEAKSNSIVELSSWL